MVTSKLALTCFKLVASLHSCHVKLVASLLQTKIVVWAHCRGPEPLPKLPHYVFFRSLQGQRFRELKFKRNRLLSFKSTESSPLEETLSAATKHGVCKSNILFLSPSHPKHLSFTLERGVRIGTGSPAPYGESEALTRNGFVVFSEVVPFGRTRVLPFLFRIRIFGFVPERTTHY
ncbi:hypothetical protein AVEN_109757-1 [Araneus ventricosus]|uniref:Uncharacterized protein n=1 Tax=Araneus ventricosus TaxID=182803 RepID=A0A4Y2NIQ7_ARAVE|nr:hypothetical protein AVEN_109757-1 [Araneus ventricosus]